MQEPGGRQNPMYALSVKVLGSMGAVRPEERRETLGAFLTLLGFMAGHALLETARDALFLARLPVSLLPWVYLTIAGIALALTRYQSALVRRFSTRNELSGWLIFCGLVTLTFWVTIPFVGEWVFYALYAWSGVLATLVVVRFWTVLGDRFTVTQAKRLFAVIGSGSVLGAILGSGMARILTELLPARHLVLSAGVVFLLASFGPVLSTPSSVTTGVRPRAGFGGIDFTRVGQLVWDRPYLRRVAIVVLMSTITFTIVDFVFKSTVARLVPDAALGEFFSSVYFTLNIVSLGVQLFAVRWLLGRVGVTTALAIVPALLLMGSVGFVASAGIATVLLLKGADGSLRYSLYRTTTELLFVPMRAEVRGHVKAFIDVLGQRGGQALGSLLVLLLLTLTTRETVFAVAAAVAAGAWVFLVLDLKTHYLDVFRETLSEEITATKIEFPALDVASLETLLTTLNSADDRKVLAALDLLAAQGKLRVVPALILYHPSPRVVLHALDHFATAGRDDILPVLDRLLSHPDDGVRAASLRVRIATLSDETMLRDAMADPSPEVRVTGVVGLAAGGWLPASEAQATLDAAIRTGTSDTQLSLARALRALPTSGLEQVLFSLVAVRDSEVQLEAVRAMRAIRDTAFVPALIDMLARRALRDEARATLVSFGSATLAQVVAALRSPSVSHAVRRHLPHTIAAFGTPQAATLLLRHLLVESDGMVRFKILRALGRLRTENPQLPLDDRMLKGAIEQNMSAAFRVVRWKRALERGARDNRRRQTDGHRALVALLRDKQAHTLERVFRLLNLQANDEEFLRIYRGFHSPKREARAGSRELIENLVQPPLRRPLLTLVDDLYETMGSEETADDEDTPGYRAVLGELLESGTESLSSLAAHHVAELGLTALHQTVRRLQPLSPAHEEVLTQVNEALLDRGVHEVPRGG